MQKILVITDIHICDLDEAIIGLDPSRRFHEVKSAALDAHPDAEMLILMGDLAHHGRESQYKRLFSTLADCPIPVIPMIGNHDRRDAFLSAFADAPQTDQGHIQKIIDLPHHRIITLDTLDGPPYPVGHHAGRLCADRMHWLRSALDGAGGRIPLVFSHHPPFDTGIIGMDAIKLADGGDLISQLVQYPRTHLFCGHIHRTISGSINGVPWTMFKSPCHQGVMDFEDPDSSLSVNEPGAYGLLLLHSDGVIAHSQDVGLSTQMTRDVGSTTESR